MIVWYCAGCGHEHKANDGFEGTKARCLRCGAVTVLPTGAGPAEDRGSGRQSGGKGRRETGLTAERPPARKDKPGQGASSEKSKVRAGSRAGRSGTKRREGEDEEPESESGGRARVAVAALLVLALAGGAFYWFFVRPRQRSGPAQVADAPRSTKTGPRPVSVPPPRPRPQTPDPDHPPAPALTETAPGPAIRMTAAQLEREYQADAAATNQKYANKLLEVRGTFQGGAAGKTGSKRLTECAFAADGGSQAVRCLLVPSPTPPEAWQKLVSGQPFTVRGTYNQDCALRNCELIKTMCPADEQYRGKEVEVAGLFDSISGEDGGLPKLKFEADTDGIVDVGCVFKASDRAELDKLKPGQFVTVRGLCSGRKYNEVRLDNCKVVYTTGPEPGTPRVAVRRFRQEYEEDVRAEPPANEEEGTEPPPALSSAQLVKEFETNNAVAERKYRRPVVVTGVVEQKRNGSVVFESDTNQKLKVYCLFAPSRFRELGSDRRLTVRGFCKGVQDRKLIRLDNCQRFDPSGPATTKEDRRVTADYSPVQADKPLIYEVATFAGSGKKTVLRQKFSYQENGTIDVTTTRVGTLKGKSLFDDGENVKWTKGVSLKPLYPLQYRLQGGNVEIGQHVVGDKGKDQIVWEPVLKLGTKAGDQWDWSSAGAEHHYVVESFGEHRGRPSLVIRQTSQASGKPVSVEVVHTYVKGVGEVERRTFQYLPGKGLKQLVGEMKLVEDTDGQDPAPETKPSLKTGSQAGHARNHPGAKGPAANETR